MQEDIGHDLDAILEVLPAPICQAVRNNGRTTDLMEVVLDLGRVPVARYINEEVPLSESEIDNGDIEAVVQRIGTFDADNRAGIERTLHRISAIRNRQGVIVGMTCRVGRAVYGTIDIIQDLVTSAASILLLGRPGIGKTTMLREAARVLAKKRRVVIVDTSNEIGGDGDIPHPAVGRSRRMQVENPARQHEVMIEAVENHNPETIIIDEIGREMEALAARTIAERGVQLIATAHGNTLENIILNPTLADLVGGVESVTLSDEEARRRGTQKTVLERRSSPTFDVLIEIVQRECLNIHADVTRSVDAHLRGVSFKPELRYRDPEGEIVVEGVSQDDIPLKVGQNQGVTRRRGMDHRFGARRAVDRAEYGLRPLRVYAYGITRQRLERVARRLHVPLRMVREIESAQALVTLKSYYRRRERPVSDAEALGVPIYVLRSHTGHQIENFLLEAFQIPSTTRGDRDYGLEAGISEAEEAIEKVLDGTRVVDLLPRAPSVRRQQHELVRAAKLVSISYGKDPKRRVRVFRD